MGQDEDAQPLVRRADFCRAEQTRRRRVAHAPKLSQDGFKAEGDVPGDVFEEYPFGAAFPDDAGHVRPEVAGVVCPLALSCHGKRLTGVSGEDGVDESAPWAAIEPLEVIPDWCSVKISG